MRPKSAVEAPTETVLGANTWENTFPVNPQIRYRRRGDKSVVNLPGNPSPMKTATETIDSAAWTLKRMDELTSVAVRYVEAMSIIRTRELKDSDARAEKAMHQLELLRKL